MAYEINRAWCKGCGICAAFCPKKALSLDDKGKALHDAEKCILCGMCELYCPDLAIAIDGDARVKAREAKKAAQTAQTSHIEEAAA